MTNPSAQEIAEAYLSYSREQSEATWWAVGMVSDFTLDKQWDEVWQVVLAIARCDEELETEVLAVVAAGPLEDILCKAGPEFIDRVEREAKFNPQFGRMLTGAWLSRAEPAVRERVVKFCRAFPHPIDEQYAF